MSRKSHCKNTSRTHSVRSCRECKSWLARQWRKTEAGIKAGQDYYQRIKDTPMNKAKTAVFMLVKSGKLPRVSTLKCMDCGIPAQVYGHRDYSKPEEAEPLCRSCNALRGPPNSSTWNNGSNHV